MPRLLALDYGLKRCGVAHTDDQQMIASGLTTLPTTQVFTFLQNYLQQHAVQALILGYPTHIDGRDTHATPLVRDFCAQLQKKYPHLKVVLENEHFSSKLALSALQQAGKKIEKHNKGLVDTVSATLILQFYLDKHPK